MDGSTSLCQVSTGQEDDWKLLYELAFPADERTAVADLRTLISNGTLLLHKTVNKQNELLCFSLVNLMSNFAFLAYIATDTTKRSTGVGSKHMKQLIQILKTQYPSYTALFLEIESTKKEGLDADTQKMRTRRLAFYQRLGAKRLSKKYGMPSYAKKGTKAAGELLWIELTENCVCDSSLVSVIQEIFLKGYGLPSTDAQVTGITDQWNNPESVCAVSEDPVTPAKETTAVDSDKTPASDSIVETTAPATDAVVETVSATDNAADATIAPAAGNQSGSAESNAVVKVSDADAPVQTNASEDALVKPTSEEAPLVPTKDENEPPQS